MSPACRLSRFAAVALVILPLLTLLPCAAQAQVIGTPSLVRDINTAGSPERAVPASRLVVVGTTLFFLGLDEATGYELWKSDGTPEGTVLVKDVWPGSESSEPSFLTNVNGMLFFFADDGLAGRELWRSDGTEAGTVRVGDIATGAASSEPRWLAAVGTQLLFATTDGVTGTELWRSDGTEAGTAQVRDIRAGADSGVYPNSAFAAVGGVVYFPGDDGTTGWELWRSDGTEAGTFLVRDIQPGAVGSNINRLEASGGNVFFNANDGVAGNELWVSDGTEAGTRLVRDVTVGAAGYSLRGLQDVNGTLFFTDETTLWRSDGTEAGTVQLTNPPPDCIRQLTDVNGTLFFSAQCTEYGNELWKSDGTTAGTVQVADINPGAASSRPAALTHLNGIVFFSASEPVHGEELWRSDGTAAGTLLVKDMFPGPSSSCPGWLTAMPLTNTLFLTADDGVHGCGLWRSDGTEAGTVMILLTAPPSSNPQPMVDSAAGLIFAADDGVNGRELWRSDGTEAGTTLLRDIRPGAASSSIGWLTDVAGTTYFVANDGATGNELWRTDGTEAGTVRVGDLFPGTNSSNPHRLVDANGTLYCTAQVDYSDVRVLRWDAALGRMVNVRVDPEEAEFWGPSFLTSANGRLYFVGYAEFGENGLYTINPAAEIPTIQRAADLGTMRPFYLVSANGTLFILGQVDFDVWEIWTSDGTPAGTRLLLSVPAPELMPLTAKPIREAVAVGGRLFFSAVDVDHGWELWSSDGTSAGTALVSDLAPGVASSNPSHLTALDGLVYFSATDGVSGYELWRSDGTAAGTTMVADINPAGGSTPAAITAVDGRLIFSAFDDATGAELWTSDGTDAGTVLVADINPDADSSRPAGFTASSGRIFFSANDGVNGAELWSLPAAPGIRSETVTGIGPAWATVRATVHSADPEATALVEYGTTAAYGSTTPASGFVVTTAAGSPTGIVAFSADLADLACNTLYHYRTVTMSGAWTAHAADSTFRTVPCSQFGLGMIVLSVRESAGSATFNVLRTGGLSAGVTLDYATSDGTATVDLDYTAVAGTLTFAAGQRSAAIVIPIVDDTLDERAETVRLTLSNPGPGALLAVRQSATLTIADNDIPGVLRFSVSQYVVSEVGPEALITVVRADGAASGVTVDYATADGTALAPADYAATSGTLSFGAGERSKTFTIPVVDDAVVEGNKVVNLALSNPAGGAVLGLGSRARLLIRENESLIQFSSPTYVTGETGTSALIAVTRGVNLAGTVTVNYTSSDGSAAAGSDYTAVSGTLTFAPGQAQRMIAVPILPDTADENGETVTLTLTDPGPAVALGPRSSATLTIRDNDTAGAVLFGTTAYFVRRTASAAVITVVRANAVSTDISVDYATADGTAVAGVDYTATSGTLSFGAREMVKTFSVPLVAGAPGGAAKTVTLTLSNPTGGATLGRVATAVLTIRD